MAIGDKLFLADKTTLDAVKAATDTVNTNTADTKAKIGTTTDTGGSATAGTIMGKLNAIISSLLTHVTNWTAARAAYLDAAISTRESEANALTRYNTLNGKLENINTNAINGGKRLVSKTVAVNVSAVGSYTIINVAGSGCFHAMRYSYLNTARVNSLKAVIDGVEYDLTGQISASSAVLCRPRYGAATPLILTTSNGSNEIGIPLYFKTSFSLVMNVYAIDSTATDRIIYATYDVYE